MSTNSRNRDNTGERSLRIGLIYDAVYPWIKGGGEKTLYELALELRDQGHEVHLFAMHCWDGPADMVQDGLYYHAVAPRSNLYDSAGKRRISQALRFAWSLSFRLPRYNLSSFDIFDIHVFPFFSLISFALLRGWYAPRTPWVATWLEVWGKDYWVRYVGPWKGGIGALIERCCAKIAPAHLCISPTTARRLHLLLGVPENRIHTIPRGFRFDGPHEPIQKISHRVVAAGRLCDYKRVDIVVRAWPRVLDAIPHATLHIIGCGPELSALQGLAKELGCERSVHFLGQLENRSDVLREIAMAELLVQPSSREGQSTVVLEAMALGTPVLAAEGPETAVADFIPPGLKEALLNVTDVPELWADRIIYWLNNEDQRQAAIELGYKQISPLDWQHSIAPRVERLYRQASVHRSSP